jgi:hypothetical protein
MKNHSVDELDVAQERDIAHLGFNFWRQLVTKSPSYCFESNNTLLLCLDDDGFLLHHFFLTRKGVSSSPIVIQACVTLAKGFGASTLVRIQTHSAHEIDPFQMKSRSSKSLYETAELYGLHLAEVVLPRP